MYVPVLTSLQMLLGKPDALKKAKETSSQLRGQYLHYCDGSYYQENQKLSIVLYMQGPTFFLCF